MAAGLVAAESHAAEPEQREQLLAAATPKLPATWRRQIAAQTGPQTPSSFGKIVRCSQFHGPRVVVIGDAAHSVTSTLGQVGICACTCTPSVKTGVQACSERCCRTCMKFLCAA